MLEQLIQITPCPTPGEAGARVDCAGQISDATQQWVNSLGFHSFHFAWGKHWGKQDVFYSTVLCTFDQGWMQQYIDEKWYEVDPIHRVIQEAQQNSHSQYGKWSDAYQYALDNPVGSSSLLQQKYQKRVNRFRELAEKSGLATGVYVAFGTPSSSMQLSLAGDEAAAHVIEGESLRKVIANMHLLTLLVEQLEGCDRCAYVKLAKHGELKEIRLTRSQKEVLSLFAANPSARTETVAQMYGCSTANINHHLGEIRQRCGQPEASGHLLALFASRNGLL